VGVGGAGCVAKREGDGGKEKGIERKRERERK